MEKGRKKKMDEKEEFIKKYHIEWKYSSVLVLYNLYLIKAMEIAEAVEDGLVIDVSEAMIALEELKKIKAFLLLIKKESKRKEDMFDISELIHFPECKLENGKLEGRMESAVNAAKKWVDDYNKKNKLENQFKYEVGIYLLLLCKKEIFF